MWLSLNFSRSPTLALSLLAPPDMSAWQPDTSTASLHVARTNPGTPRHPAATLLQPARATSPPLACPLVPPPRPRAASPRLASPLPPQAAALAVPVAGGFPPSIWG